MDLVYPVSGFLVGVVVGLTGVGGGSLMTPLLILLYGFSPSVAVGTDLLYAAITKSAGTVAHHRRRNIAWPVVRWLSAGSLPAAVLTLVLLHAFVHDASALNTLLSV